MPEQGREHLLAELGSAICAVPFEGLGLHERSDGPGIVLRIWQPDSEWVEVVDRRAKRALGRAERVGETDLFELVLPRRRKFFPYLLRVSSHGLVHETLDPYQFRKATFADRSASAIRLYDSMGAQLDSLAGDGGLKSEGTLISVYAPSARAVSLVGDFNAWDGRRHPMQSSYEGIWRLFLPEFGPGELYKFEIKGPGGNLLPAKADPFGMYCEQPPGNASIVLDRNAYDWQDGDYCWLRDERGYANDQPVSIYEVHPASWRRHSDGRHYSYREFADTLIPYVREMGFTHIELMPITEHPFLGSWGYQTTAMFAPSSRYGSPDDFKYFVDQAHLAGVSVILDWVPAHFPGDEHGLALFDGTALFEHPDPRRGWHPDWSTYIYDYGRQFVRDFLVSSALYWVEEYHVDGLRVDAVASMLYLDYSRNAGEWLPNIYGGNENLEAIDFIKQMNEVVQREHPGVMTIAEESTAWPKVSRPTYDGGLGFGFKWNMGWMHDTLSYMSKDPVYRKYHHGDLTFSLVYAFDEHFILPLSHDEVVHGKGSLIGKMPGDDWQKHANLRLYFAFMYAHPGKKLLFMGAELAQVREWNHDWELDWGLLEQPLHAGMQRLLKDINQLYVAQPALYEVDFAGAGFDWIDHTDADQGLIAFRRRSAAGDGNVVVVCNLTPVVRHGFRLGVDEPGDYRELLNTDADIYGGSNVGNAGRVGAESIGAHGREWSVQLALPPLATLYLQRVD